MRFRCFYCECSVDPQSTQVFRRVRGWEKRNHPSSSRRGGSDIVLREHLDSFACGVCIERLRSGLSVEQGSLL